MEQYFMLCVSICFWEQKHLISLRIISNQMLLNPSSLKFTNSHLDFFQQILITLCV